MSQQTATDSRIPLPKTSAPAQRALEHIGITTLNHLTGHTKKEILNLHGMGPKALRILEEVLKQNGLDFLPDNK